MGRINSFYFGQTSDRWKSDGAGTDWPLLLIISMSFGYFFSNPL